MKNWYCVTNSYYDNGRVTAAITNIIQSEQKPEDTYNEGKRCDVYNNWFDNINDANKFIAQCRQA